MLTLAAATLGFAAPKPDANIYTLSNGYLAGSTQPSWRNMTVDDAKTACDADGGCIGFTYQWANYGDPPGAIWIALMGVDSEYVGNSNWSSYIKEIPPSGGGSFPYLWRNGFYSANDERPNSPRYLTVADARSACDADSGCVGFTFEPPGNICPVPSPDHAYACFTSTCWMHLVGEHTQFTPNASWVSYTNLR